MSLAQAQINCCFATSLFIVGNNWLAKQLVLSALLRAD